MEKSENLKRFGQAVKNQRRKNQEGADRVNVIVNVTHLVCLLKIKTEMLPTFKISFDKTFT